MMIKSQRVVPIAEAQPYHDDVVFEQKNEDYPSIVECQFTMTVMDWEDMGSPEVVTLTVEPGDTLNLPGAAAVSEHVAEATVVPRG